MRIQILELPYNPDEPERPYAVVVSEIAIDMKSTDEGEHSSAAIAAAHWGQKIRDGGADWCVFTADKVELGPEWVMPERRFTSSIPPIAVGGYPGFVEHFDGPTL